MCVLSWVISFIRQKSRTTEFAPADLSQPPMANSSMPVLPTSDTPPVVPRSRMGCLKGKSVSPPARWHPALSCGPSPLRARTTSRAPWQRAHRLRCQHDPLSSLSVARTMPGLWGSNEEAAPGQCHSPSTCRTSTPGWGDHSGHGNRPEARAGLESLRDPTGVDAALVQSTGRCASSATTTEFSPKSAFAPLPRPACPTFASPGLSAWLAMRELRLPRR